MEEHKQIPNGSSPPSVPPLPAQRKFSLLYLWIILGMTLVSGVGWFGYQQFLSRSAVTLPDQATLTNLPTYFSYKAEDLQMLKDTEAPQSVTTIEDLYQWEERAYQVVAKGQSADVYASKVYAYLTVARRDYLLLTKSILSDFQGDTSVISKQVLCEFYPTVCGSIVVRNSDAFSEQLSDVVMKKVRQRIADDAKITKDYSLKKGEQYWQSNDSKIGIAAGSYKPWSLEKGDQFRVSAYPQFAQGTMAPQLAITKKALTTITSTQRKAVVFWAGGPGTKTPPGIWLDLSGEYMLNHKASVETYIDTQAFLAVAMADAVIAVFDSKYTYQIRRPFMLDDTIKTVMPTPNHPSYPAGHSTISGAAIAILDEQLPENTKEWNRLAIEAGNSRIWGGIHYQIDHEVGYQLGKTVGNYSLTHFGEQ